MLSTLFFIIIYLVVLQNSEAALIDSPSNIYIKNKLRDTKELLNKSYSLPYARHKSIKNATIENLNEIDSESWNELWNKKADASTANLFNDKTIFEKCVKRLQKLLDHRLKMNIDRNWISLRKMYLKRSSIDSASFEMGEHTNVSRVVYNPIELKSLSSSNLADIVAKEQVISEKHIFFKNEKTHLLSGAIALNGIVNFHELSISNLSATYLMDKKLDRLLISGTDQSFSTELRNLRNFIKNLQVNSICGLSFKYWLRSHDGSGTGLNEIDLKSCSFYNETAISIGRENSTYRVPEIHVKQINGVDIKDVVKSSFLLSDSQVIQGNLVSIHPLRAVELFVEKVNNVSSSRLLNKVKNESMTGEVAIDKLEVQHLLVDQINEVNVSDAARMSEENIIKGKVTISNLLIKNQVTVKENVAVPLNSSMQVYDDVLIVGNVFVKNVQIESENGLTITLDLRENNRNKTRQVNSNEILERSWRKSEVQVIPQNVQFEKGASIDELECLYLNGFREHDFVYSDSDVLQMENVTFNHVHLVGQFLGDKSRPEESSLAVEGFFRKMPSDVIVFDKLISFSRFSVNTLALANYNGIPVDNIMHETNASNDFYPLDFPRDSSFEVFRASGQMHVRNLNVSQINLRSASIFEKAMRSDKNLKIDKLGGTGGKRKVKSIRMNNVKIKYLHGKNVEDGLLKQENLVKNSRKKIALTIAEKLKVENTLNITDRKLSGWDLEYYIEGLKKLHLDNLFEMKRIKRMEVLRHLNVHHLLMEKLEDVFAEAFSISSHQVLPSRKLMVEHAKIDYLTSERLNKVQASSLMRTESPLFINGSKHFSSLVVEGNIKTKRLNDKFATTEVEQLKINGSMLNNKSVHIFGLVFWEDGSYSSPESVKELFDYAVTKSGDQSLDCSLVVEQATAIDSLAIANKNSSLVLNKINEVLSDCLIDDSTAGTVGSVVTGRKELRKQVKANHAKVLRNIKTQSINHDPFDKLISRLFRKSENKRTSAKLTFLHELEIESLRTRNSNGESLSVHQFALTDGKIMPSRLAFKHLIVEGNVSLRVLDKVVFDEFIANRVSIVEPYEFFADVQFNQSIAVLNKASLVVLNGIRDKHFVLPLTKGSSATLIKGRKNFSSVLSIENNLDVTSLASDFNDSFVNVNNTEIFGDLEFEEDVESSSDILLLGQWNNTGLELSGEPSMKKLRKILISKTNAINEWAAVRVTNKLSGHFLYLEKITGFNLDWLTNVQAVTSTTIDNSNTRLDLYTSEAGTFCGLPVDCPCRAHSLLEISSAGDHRVVQAKSSNVIFNFHAPRGPLGLRVLSEPGETDEAVPSGEHCFRREAAGASIFWTKLNARGEAELEKLALRIEGIIAHAQVFLINDDKLYMVLAKFYDNASRTYATDSLVYEFDLGSKAVNKCQSIQTEGAKVVHIFQAAKTGVYALIGCVKGKAESLLLRFDPTTRQFQLIRTFTTGGSKHVASLSDENKSYVILSNPDIEALQIYNYNPAFDNFYDYQNLYFQSRVSSLNVFFSEDFGQSKAYLTVTTKDGLFYIYQYTFSGKFKMIMSYRIEDFQVLSPFRIGNQNYLFASHRLNSTIFKVVQDNN